MELALCRSIVIQTINWVFTSVKTFVTKPCFRLFIGLSFLILEVSALHVLGETFEHSHFLFSFLYVVLLNSVD